MAGSMLIPEFSMAELRGVYNAVWHTDLADIPAGKSTRKMRSSLNPTGQGLRRGAPAWFFKVAGEWNTPPWNRPENRPERWPWNRPERRPENPPEPQPKEELKKI